ncbi:MAG: hypothetical protein ACREKH_18240 [Candidatus Rokuibacteriota bacterium]
MALAAALLLQETREVFLADRPIEVRVPISTDARHPATVVTFPEESLEALVAGWNEADLSVERRRENLFIKLLRRAEGDLHVLGASGTLYRLAIRAAEGPYDGHVRIRLPVEGNREAAEPVELLRAMRLGRRPSRGTVFRASEPVYASPEIAARTAYIYDAPSYRGFVLRVENVSAIPQRLDPSRFVGRDLVLVGARDLLLRPGDRTDLYLVFWKIP